jgi:hypothetical protein
MQLGILTRRVRRNWTFPFECRLTLISGALQPDHDRVAAAIEP